VARAFQIIGEQPSDLSFDLDGNVVGPVVEGSEDRLVAAGLGRWEIAEMGEHREADDGEEE
jgi:hypothetical protein